MKDSKIATAFLGLIVVFIAGVVLRLAKPVLLPFFVAIFLSFILYPVLDFSSTRLKIPKAISIFLILIITFMVIYLLGVLFYSSGKTFASEFPKYGQKISSILESLQERLKLAPFEWDPLEWVGQLDINRIGSFLFASLGTFFSFISNLFLILVFLIFILLGRGNTKPKIQSSFDKRRASQIIKVIQNIDSQVQKYLAIKTIISLVTGVFVTIVLLLFGLDFAIVFGFLTFLLNYIPTVGSVIATAFPVIIAVFQFESLWPALWILLILTVIQQSLGGFVEPKLMGEGLGLSPLVVLFSLFFWGWLWGILGMILAVPIAAMVKIICSNVPSLKFVGELMSKA
jgi:predicted PurR-regulated permease PerM